MQNNLNSHLVSAIRYRLIGLAVYLALLIMMPFFIIKNHDSQALVYFSLAIWWAPLLIALPGLFKGKTYTYGWTGFIILLPFFYAFFYIIEPDKFQWSLIISILCVIYFFASVLYVKKNALGHGIKTNQDAKKAKGLE